MDVPRSALRSRVRDILTQWHSHLTGMLGHPPLAEEFYPLDLSELTAFLGWQLEETEYIGVSVFGEPIRGACNREKKTITLSRHGSNKEARFTLAHELGHAVLGHKQPACSESHRTRSARIRRLYMDAAAQRRETEANRFATSLLMPDKAVLFFFRQLFGDPPLWSGSRRVLELARSVNLTSKQKERLSAPDSGTVAAILAIASPVPDVPSLANRFDVSERAMAIRIGELRLVTP